MRGAQISRVCRASDSSWAPCSRNCVSANHFRSSDDSLIEHYGDHTEIAATRSYKKSYTFNCLGVEKIIDTMPLRLIR